MRIVFLGEGGQGSCSLACAKSLKRLGEDVIFIDQNRYFPQWQSLHLRIAFRLMRTAILAEYNKDVESIVQRVRPDVIFVSKGPMILPETVRRIRDSGIRAINLYPDSSVFTHTPWLPHALPEYNLVVFAHRHCRDAALRLLKLQSTAVVLHGYDPDVHRPEQLSALDIEEFSIDVAIIATHTRFKESLIDDVLRKVRPGLTLGLWGNGWEPSRSTRIRSVWRGSALEGQRYAKAIRAARIAVGILSGPVGGEAVGDGVTTRTFEIPAVGGFMLHERTAELAEVFTEGEECGCFSSATEFVEKSEYYLEKREQRQAIAAAGHRRCVPAYSYDERMRDIISLC